MAIRNKKEMEVFYEKALKKILNFRADDLTIEEFTQLKRYAEKLEVYRFVRRNNGKRKGIGNRIYKSLE